MAGSTEFGCGSSLIVPLDTFAGARREFSFGSDIAGEAGSCESGSASKASGMAGNALGR